MTKRASHIWISRPGDGALNLGHNPKEVIKAVNEAQELPAVLLVGHNPLMGALGNMLASILPGDLSVTIFGCGGAEAVQKRIENGSCRHRPEEICIVHGGLPRPFFRCTFSVRIRKVSNDRCPIT